MGLKLGGGGKSVKIIKNCIVNFNNSLIFSKNWGAMAPPPILLVADPLPITQNTCDDSSSLEKIQKQDCNGKSELQRHD